MARASCRQAYPAGCADASTSTTQSMFMDRFHLRPNKRSGQVGQPPPSSDRLLQRFKLYEDEVSKHVVCDKAICSITLTHSGAQRKTTIDTFRVSTRRPSWYPANPRYSTLFPNANWARSQDLSPRQILGASHTSNRHSGVRC